MKSAVLRALVPALALTFAIPAFAKQETNRQQKELEQARKELREAREELKRAAAELARATREMEPDSPRVRAFELLSNPKRAVLGVGIAAGPEKKGDVRGVLLTAVTPGSGADKAGLKSGDLLLSANGKSLLARKGERPGPERKLRDLLSELSPGDKVDLEYEREGRSERTTVIAQRPEALDLGAVMDFDDEDLDVVIPRFPHPRGLFIERHADMKLAKLDSDLGSYFQTQDGVLVIGVPSEGAMGLKSGDVIQKIDGESVKSPVEAMDRLREAGEKEIALDILRHGKRESLKGKSPASRWSKRHRIEIHSDGEP